MVDKVPTVCPLYHGQLLWEITNCANGSLKTKLESFQKTSTREHLWWWQWEMEMPKSPPSYYSTVVNGTTWTLLRTQYSTTQLALVGSSALICCWVTELTSTPPTCGKLLQSQLRCSRTIKASSKRCSRGMTSMSMARMKKAALFWLWLWLTSEIQVHLISSSSLSKEELMSKLKMSIRTLCYISLQDIVLSSMDNITSIKQSWKDRMLLSVNA